LKGLLIYTVLIGFLMLIGAALLGQPVVGFLGFVVAVGASFLMTQQRIKKHLAEDPENGLPDSLRAELSEIRAHKRKLQRFVDDHRKNPTVAVIGVDVLHQADKIHRAAASAVMVRRQLRRSADLAPGSDAATQMKAQIEGIDRDLEAATAKLAELHAVLAAQTLAEAGEAPAEEIRDRLSQLQSLSASLDEVRQLDLPQNP
jgi:hypothetical protein